MRHLKRNYLLLVSCVFLILLYFSVRLFNLVSLPIFTDEAIYLRWAQTGLNDPAYRFLSLTDGKQPFFIWVMMPFMRVFTDPLIAGRMVSVLSGCATMLGLGAVSYTLFKNKSTAILTMLLYVAYPFAQVIDRLAIYDSMVATFFIWALYLSILLIRHLRLDLAYTLGIVLGAGILTKTSNLLSIYLLPLTVVIFDFKRKNVKKELFKWVSLAGFSVLISQVMYQILRLSPVPNVISQKNNSFYYPFGEWIKNPLAYVLGNLNGMVPPLVTYLTIPYIILIVISLLYIKKDFREKIMVFLFFLLPFGGFAFIASTVFARYFFFMSLPLIILAGWSMEYVCRIASLKVGKPRIKKAFAIIFIIFIIILYPLYVSIAYANNPLNAPMPKGDKMQYVTQWTSGWNLKDVVTFFRSEAQKGPIYVATEGTFGLYPQGIELYLAQNKDITLKGFYWEITNTFPAELKEQALKMPTYFVFYQPCPGGICPRPGDAPKGWPVKQVREFLTPGTTTRVVIYQVVE